MSRVNENKIAKAARREIESTNGGVIKLLATESRVQRHQDFEIFEVKWPKKNCMPCT